MALFSLLFAIVIERLKLLPLRWQFESLLCDYRKYLFSDRIVSTQLGVLAAILLPAFVLSSIISALSGVLYGIPMLILWSVTAAGCFAHQHQRKVFKSYIQSACRGDVEASFHFANELDCADCLHASSEKELGVRVGQTVAWLSYRYYGAVALYLIVFGPVGAVFYCTVRFFDEQRKRQEADWPILERLLYILDWLPCRIVAFSYVLSGQFSTAFERWIQLVFTINMSQRYIVTEVALAAETIPEDTETPVSLQSTFALLALSKRNSTLLITILSLLTIFGLVA